MKNEVDRFNTFCAMFLTDTHTHTRTDTQSDCKKPLAGFNNAKWNAAKWPLRGQGCLMEVKSVVRWRIELLPCLDDEEQWL